MDQLNPVLAALTGVAVTAIIGAVKSLEAKVNIAVVSKLGNLTPVLVAALALVLPKVSTLLGLTNLPDAQTVASAPVATMIAIALREAAVKLFHLSDPGAAGAAK